MNNRLGLAMASRIVWVSGLGAIAPLAPNLQPARSRCSCSAVLATYVRIRIYARVQKMLYLPATTCNSSKPSEILCARIGPFLPFLWPHSSQLTIHKHLCLAHAVAVIKEQSSASPLVRKTTATRSDHFQTMMSHGLSRRSSFANHFQK